MPGPLIVVGGGLSGALTAYYARRAGMAVTLVARGPDPRLDPDPTAATFAGEDLRFVSLLEGRLYLGADPNQVARLPDYTAAFAQTVQEGGWLDRPLAGYSPPVRAWLRARTERGLDRAWVQAQSAQYLTQNQRAQALWRALIADAPELFRGTELHSEGILRLYSHPALLHLAERLHKQHGALRRVVCAQELRSEQPALAAACASGACIGGLVVDGLAFRAQTFVRNLMSWLQGQGCELRFRCPLTAIERDGAGRVQGLRMQEGEVLHAQHYALCLGAYDTPGLLAGTPAAEKIMRVMGLWLRMPAPQGLSVPLKLQGTRRTESGTQGLHPLVDLNLHVLHEPAGSAALYVSGGYLFVGPSSLPIDDAATQAARAVVLCEIHAMLDRFLGDAFRSAHAKGLVAESPRACLRSFTADDQELQVSLPAHGPHGEGQLLIGGGGNTGTTAKAPFVALRALGQLDGATSFAAA